MLTRVHRAAAAVFLALFVAWVFVGGWHSFKESRGRKIGGSGYQSAENQFLDEQNGIWGHSDPGVTLVTALLVIVGSVQVGLFLFQLTLIRESLVDAKKAADAALLNAEAIMAAEGAHLFVIIKADTVLDIFKLAGWYDNSPTMHSSKMNAPGLQYVLKNYGKTPAILQHVWHGISIQKTPGEMRTLIAREGALEILGAGAETAESVVSYFEPFTFGDARALVQHETILYFYGEADYSDTFGVAIKLQWEFIADHGVFRQTQHRERRQTPEKGSYLGQHPKAVSWPVTPDHR
jgi:hypothetical protein